MRATDGTESLAPLRIENNDEFLMRMLHECPQGALAYVVLFQAAMQYTDEAAKVEDIPDTELFTGQQFKDACEWVNEEFRKHFGVQE